MLSAIENLSLKPTLNQLFIGVLIDYQKNYKTLNIDCAFFLELFDKTTKESLFFFQPRPECALISANNADLINFLISELLRLQIKINAMIGPTSTLEILQKHWHNQQASQIKILMSQNLMLANTIIMPTTTAGKLVPATLNDFDFLRETANAFYQETSPNLSIHEDHLKLRIKIALENKEYFLWNYQNTNVGFVQIGRPVLDSISILALFVLPKFRFQKIGANLLARTCLHLLSKYKTCILFTDNSVSHTTQLYQKIGFSIESQFQHISFIF
jgi:predicted GNAT family acetyltransferase